MAVDGASPQEPKNYFDGFQLTSTHWLEVKKAEYDEMQAALGLVLAESEKVDGRVSLSDDIPRKVRSAYYGSVRWL